MQKSRDIWKENPEIIQNFLSIHNDFQQLCVEIEYIIKKRISESNIEIASISSRAKTLNSFIEKTQRKYYKEPLKEIKDFAGVRVVCLYASDVSKINSIIEKEFDIQEEVDKRKNLKNDQFGYGAHHFIVKLGKTSSGARYDYLKEIPCEIQVRTIVQDAWSIIQHHMVYKKETEIPSSIQRKLNSLSALFETVDDQFESIRDQRDIYINSVRETKNNKLKFLNNELNIETFKEYLEWKYPDMIFEKWDGQASIVLNALIEKKFNRLSDIENLIDATKLKTEELMNDLQNKLLEVCEGKVPSNVIPALALSIKTKDPHEIILWPDDWVKIIEKYTN